MAGLILKSIVALLRSNECSVRNKVGNDEKVRVYYSHTMYPTVERRKEAQELMMAK